MMFKGVIYERKNIINGKKYIGQTINLTNRNYVWNNKNKKYGGNYINNAKNKYGIENFETTILTTIYSNDKDELHTALNEFEKMYISVYNTLIPNGYNISEGGQGSNGHKMPNDLLEKLRKLSTGRHPSKETREKMSKSHKGIDGHKPTEEQIFRMKKKMGKPVLMYDKNDKLLNRFMSIREAAEKLNISHIQISRCCNNKLKTTMGYIFKFDTQEDQDESTNDDQN